MIGQSSLLTIIDEQIMLDEFPRFGIIVGPEGSGKKTLSNAIAMALNAHRVFVEPKVDAVRDMIHNAYSVGDATLYVVLDGFMSESAKNAMLKICEETPKNAYICMLVTDISTVLDTLRSRAGIYFMQPYTPEEILEYADVDSGNEKIVTDLCETPGDVDKLMFSGINEFYGFVEKVVDSIADVSPANALKIVDKLDVKNNDAEKYDVTLFLRAFKAICGNRMRQAVAENNIESQMWYSAGIKVVTHTLQQMQITGVNKGALLDIFILDIRREWL